MAYSIPSQNAAYGYAANFKPMFDAADLTRGYQTVKSNDATNLMSEVLAADFAAKTAMAQGALKEYGAQIRQNSVNDTSLEIEALRNKQSSKAGKLQALLGLLDLGGASAFKSRSATDALQNRKDSVMLTDNALARDLNAVQKITGLTPAQFTKEALKGAQPSKTQKSNTGIVAAPVLPKSPSISSEENKYTAAEVLDFINKLGQNTVSTKGKK
jgi:hypothetical protein